MPTPLDWKQVLTDFVDHLAPRLDTYETAIYLHVLRQSRMNGQDETVVGFKSARKQMPFGSGEKGKRMAEGTAYEKLRSLEAKGCLKILGSERMGTRLHVLLPSEMPGVVPAATIAHALSLEEMDFYIDASNREAILRREAGKCFYCLRSIDVETFVIEHVTNRRSGGNGYRNVVAACRSCNNKKNDQPADDFLRSLYRSGLLSTDDLEGRLAALRRLAAGEVQPERSIGR